MRDTEHTPSPGAAAPPQQQPLSPYLKFRHLSAGIFWWSLEGGGEEPCLGDFLPFYLQSNPGVGEQGGGQGQPPLPPHTLPVTLSARAYNQQAQRPPGEWGSPEPLPRAVGNTSLSPRASPPHSHQPQEAAWAPPCPSHRGLG